MDQRSGDHQTALHTAGKTPCLFETAVPELQLGEIFLGALQGQLAPYPVIAGLVDHDIQHGVEQVQVNLLWHEADAGFSCLWLTVDAVSENLDFAGGLVDKRTNDADCRGLARTIGAEKCIEVASLDIEVDSFQRVVAVRVDLGKFLDRQCLHGAAYCIRGGYDGVE